MNEREAQLLRALGDEIALRISPELPPGPLKERLRFAELMVKRMATNIDVASAVASDLLPRYGAVSGEAQALLSRHERAAPSGSDPGADLAALRRDLTGLIRTLSERDGTKATDDVFSHIVTLETERHRELQRRQSHSAPTSGGAANKNNVFELVTIDSLTAYLREKIDPRIEVTDVRVQPGGRSKYTIFVSTAGRSALPPVFVMRQDTGSTHIPTDITDEFPVLKTMSEAGLPVPKPLYLEPNKTALGGPFMLVTRVEGVVAGDYYAGLQGADAPFAKELARTLGRMHSLDLRQIKLRNADPEKPSEQHFAELVSFYRDRWQRDAMEPSLLVESGYAWLMRQARRSMGPTVLVHGDMAAHNWLQKDGRLSALLDWEFVHFGCAGEDLGYCRFYVEKVLPWRDFMAIYHDAGGPVLGDNLILAGSIWGQVRNTTFSAGSAREYADGHADFTQGAFAYGVLPMLEERLAPLLKKAWKDV